LIREQDFLNYVALHDYRHAIELALSLSQPGRLFKLFKDLAASGGDDVPFTGHAAVDEVLRTLDATDLVRLLRYVREWNARASSAAVAQGVLYAMVKLRSADELMHALEGSVDDGTNRTKLGSTTALEVIDGLIPYTERHLARIDRLVQESYIVDYILSEMDNGIAEDDEPKRQMDIDPVAVACV